MESERMSENLTIDEILRQAEEIRKKTARKAEAAIDKIHATQTPLEPQPKEPTEIGRAHV